DLGGLLRVAAEAGEGELLGPDHAGGDLDDADRAADDLQAEGLGEDVLGVLGGDVAGAALVGGVARGGGDHDDGAVAAGVQLGEQRLGEVEGADHVGLVHPAPVVGVAGGDGVGAECAARVVDEDADGLEGGGELVDRGAVGDVEGVGGRGVPGGVDLLGDGLDAVLAACGEDDPVAGGCQSACGGGADSAARTGDDGDAGGCGRCGAGHVC